MPTWLIVIYAVLGLIFVMASAVLWPFGAPRVRNERLRLALGILYNTAFAIGLVYVGYVFLHSLFSPREPEPKPIAVFAVPASARSLPEDLATRFVVDVQSWPTRSIPCLRQSSIHVEGNVVRLQASLGPGDARDEWCLLEAAAWTRSWLKKSLGAPVEVLSFSGPSHVAVPYADPRSLQTLARTEPAPFEDLRADSYRVIAYQAPPEIRRGLEFAGDLVAEDCAREAEPDGGTVRLRWTTDGKRLYAVAVGSGTERLYRGLACMDVWARRAARTLGHPIEPLYVPPLWQRVKIKEAQGKLAGGAWSPTPYPLGASREDNARGG